MQSSGSVKLCLIWEQAPLVTLTVALCLLYFGGLGERRKSRECARAQRFVSSKAGLGQWFPKWDVCDQSLRCQGEMIFVISLLSFTFFLFGRMFYNYINIHTLLFTLFAVGVLEES